jgi:aminopeptidase C
MELLLHCAVQVVVVNDPRPHNPYGHLYTVEYLNNMVNSPLVLYINQPAAELKRLALESIKAGEVCVYR